MAKKLNNCVRGSRRFKSLGGVWLTWVRGKRIAKYRWPWKDVSHE